MTFKAARLACLLPAGVLLATAACAQQKPTEVLVPVTEMVAAGGPGNGEGWASVGSVGIRPALSLYQGGRPILVLTCRGFSTQVQVRGLEPKQAWPQPDMVIRFGQTLRTGSPDVRNIGDQVAYELDFRIADDVLEAIRSTAPIIVEFNDQTRSAAPIPGDEARVFAERCASLVPAGMRQSSRSQG